MSLKRPSYFFRMVFLVLKYSGQPFIRAWLKQAWAKPRMDSSVLYMARATPSLLKLNTSNDCTSPPSSGVKVMVSLPLPLARKSVARYWSPKAWRPIQMGDVQLGTRRGMLLITMGSRNTMPSRMLRMVPFDDLHICLRLNSFTRFSSGVMVAHLMPTPYCLIALAESMVTWSLVSSRCSIPRS